MMPNIRLVLTGTTALAAIGLYLLWVILGGVSPVEGALYFALVFLIVLIILRR